MQVSSFRTLERTEDGDDYTFYERDADGDYIDEEGYTLMQEFNSDDIVDGIHWLLTAEDNELILEIVRNDGTLGIEEDGE